MVVKSALLFVLAAILEIGGAWLVWQGVREHRGLTWVGAGVIAFGLRRATNIHWQAVEIHKAARAAQAAADRAEQASQRAEQANERANRMFQYDQRR